MLRILHDWFSGKRRRKPVVRPARAPRQVRLGLEALETRELLSANVPGFSLSNGNLYNTAISSTQPIDTGVQAILGTNGQTLFEVHGNGNVYSWTGSTEQSLGNNPALAQGTVAQWFVGLDGQGNTANQVVLDDGSAYEYSPSAGAWQETDSGGVKQLYAGVDAQGRSATLVLCTNGDVYARNGSVGSSPLGSNPALAQGTITEWFVGPDDSGQIANQVALSNGSVYEYSPSAGAWQQTDSGGVQQLYAGVDAKGRLATLVLDTNGSVFARNSSVGSSQLGTCPAFAQGSIAQWFVGPDINGQIANQVVLTNGSLYEYSPSAGAWQETDSGGVKQLYAGVDAQGRSATLVLCTNGSVFARNSSVGSSQLGTCPAFAQGSIAQWFVGPDINGQIANQVVLTNGSLYEYSPSAGAWQQTDSGGVQQLFAGVDAGGRPATLVLCTNGSVYARNSSVGSTQLGSNPAFAQGMIAQWFVGPDINGKIANQVVLTNGSLYEYSPSAGAWQQTDSGGVQQLYAGVDAQGRSATLVFCTNGSVYARNGSVDQQLSSTAVSGGTFYLLNGGNLITWSASPDGPSARIIASSVTSYQVAGDGTLYYLQSGNLFGLGAQVNGQLLNGYNVSSYQASSDGSVYWLGNYGGSIDLCGYGKYAHGQIADGVSSFQVAGDGTLYYLQSGNLFGLGAQVNGQVTSSVQSFAVRSDGSLYVLHTNNNLVVDNVSGQQLGDFGTIQGFMLRGDGNAYIQFPNGDLILNTPTQKVDFGLVSDLQIRSDGNFYVLRPNNDLALYTPDGVMVADFGVVQKFVLGLDGSGYFLQNGNLTHNTPTANNITLDYSGNGIWFNVDSSGAVVELTQAPGVPAATLKVLPANADPSSGWNVIDTNVVQWAPGHDGSLFMVDGDSSMWQELSGGQGWQHIWLEAGACAVRSFAVSPSGWLVVLFRDGTLWVVSSGQSPARNVKYLGSNISSFSIDSSGQIHVIPNSGSGFFISIGIPIDGGDSSSDSASGSPSGDSSGNSAGGSPSSSVANLTSIPGADGSPYSNSVLYWSQSAPAYQPGNAGSPVYVGSTSATAAAPGGTDSILAQIAGYIVSAASYLKGAAGVIENPTILNLLANQIATLGTAAGWADGSRPAAWFSTGASVLSLGVTVAQPEAGLVYLLLDSTSVALSLSNLFQNRK